jgi:hypothetical protein
MKEKIESDKSALVAVEMPASLKYHGVEILLVKVEWVGLLHYFFINITSGIHRPDFAFMEKLQYLRDACHYK